MHRYYKMCGKKAGHLEVLRSMVSRPVDDGGPIWIDKSIWKLERL